MKSRTSSAIRSGLSLLLTALMPLAAGLALAGSEEPQTGTADGTEQGNEPEETSEEEKTRNEPLFERLEVVDRPPQQIPGAVDVIGREELRKQSYSDVNRVLRLVPGVNIQEEEGYGLRPNIGLRGSGTLRSARVTLMEDGVLIAPAPYAAPAAYYFPTTGRMEGVEVRKGSSAIRNGPYTVGGAVSLTSSSIPGQFGGRVNLAGGSDAMRRGHVWLGDSHERFGWMVETFQMGTRGFKDLDGGGDTGFELSDYMGKLRVNSGDGASFFQALEFKLGKVTQDGNETYLGLTDADFAATPYRRYAGSQTDRIETDHEQLQLRYFAKPSQRVDITATAYRNEFFRSWHKLDKVGGVGIAAMVDDPELYAYEMAVTRGEIDSQPDELVARNNRRNYFSQGVQAVIGWQPDEAGHHELEFSLRYHEDEEDRFQNDDGYRMAQGQMILTSAGPPGSAGNRINDARAVAAFAQDTIRLERWTIVPGVRVESIDFTRLDYGPDDPDRTGIDSQQRENASDVVLPGIGASYRLSRTSNLFAGIHRGFAPPGAGADAATRPELSVNYELGYRRNSQNWSAQVAGFFNDYENLLGTDTIASGGTGSGDQYNGGEANLWGLEAGLNGDLGRVWSTSLSLPWRVNYTWTRSRFLSSFETEFEGWGDEVRDGDEMPYLPHHQVTLGIGAARPKWSVDLNVVYVDQMRTVPGQGPIPFDQRVDSYVVADVSGGYEIHRQVRLFLQVRNLTDSAYAVARRPAGLRPGLSRTALVGVSWDF